MRRESEVRAQEKRAESREQERWKDTASSPKGVSGKTREEDGRIVRPPALKGVSGKTREEEESV